jgi:hypothetical protein
MATAAVELVNQALALLGERGITSFDDGTAMAGSAAQLYPDTVAALLDSYPWRFGQTKARLARLADPPLAGWSYAHALPADLIRLRALYASPDVDMRPCALYDVAEGRVLSNQPELWADYLRAQDPATWSPAFRNLARYALAADLAVAVTGSTSQADFMRRIAFGTPQEAGNGGLMQTARRQDAQQAPPRVLADDPLLAARFGSR